MRLLDSLCEKVRKSAMAEIKGLDIEQTKNYALRKHRSYQNALMMCGPLLTIGAATAVISAFLFQEGKIIHGFISLGIFPTTLASFIPVMIKGIKLDAGLEHLKNQDVEHEFVASSNGPKALQFKPTKAEAEAKKQQDVEQVKLNEKKAAEDFKTAVRDSIKLQSPLPYKGPIKVQRPSTKIALNG